MGAYLNEHLNEKNADISRSARFLRKQNKIQATWTRLCKVIWLISSDRKSGYGKRAKKPRSVQINKYYLFCLVESSLDCDVDEYIGVQQKLA